MDWLDRTATQQGRAIMAGLVSPVDLTEAYLDAATRSPDRDLIFARLTPERARSEAIAAHDRAKAGQRRGMLDGVAISWKDNFDSAGVATEAGSALLAGRTPEADAKALQNAAMAGLICLGKTHMTELAFSGLGINPRTATPPNALDPALAPGGSSSGSAVSVALSLASASIGSDTGGSIRTPAAWNGLVGFKPTAGRVSSDGIVPLCPGFDVAGPLARSVEDCASLLAAITATRPPDLADPPTALRLLVLEGAPFESAREAPVTAFTEAVEHLSRAGARITHAAPPCVAEALELSSKLFAPEAYGVWSAHIEADPEAMYPPILARFRAGAEVSAPEYVAAWRTLTRLRAIWADEVAGFDAVILPTSPILPPDREKLLADSNFFASENMLSLRNTRIGNLFGLPAISLPTNRPACGIMAMGAAGGDLALLRIAAAMETALQN